MKRDPYHLVNTKLGRYQILEYVGSGGMGAVYRAQHEIYKGDVAVKVLKPDLATEHPEMVNFFFAEAEKTVSLDHPHIISVKYADVSPEGLAFLAMEWLEGWTLEQEIRQTGKMALERITILLEQICQAVTHAHEHGIIHRDLKPSNVMIVTNYQGQDAAKILDFGIAKALNSTSGANSRAMGSPYYASPEQLSLNSYIDHRSDIYSLGILLYEALAGKVPFEGDSIGRIIQQHISVPPPSILESRPDLPEAVAAVLRRSMAKRPEDRFGSATDLARAFRQAASLDPGSLTVRCIDGPTGLPVAGASVYLNGEYAGSTNDRGLWQTQGAPAREHLLEIGCPQYLAWERHLHISPRSNFIQTVELTPKVVGELTIKTSVARAEVLVNGRSAGVTNEAGLLRLADLAEGTATIEIKHPRHAPLAAEVEIKQGQPLHWDASLPPLAPLPKDRKYVFAVLCGVAAVSLAVLLAKPFWRGGKRAIDKRISSSTNSVLPPAVTPTIAKTTPIPATPTTSPVLSENRAGTLSALTPSPTPTAVKEKPAVPASPPNSPQPKPTPKSILPSEDISGTWRLVVRESGKVYSDYLFELKQKGNEVSGVLRDKQNGESYRVTGNVQGNRVVLTTQIVPAVLQKTPDATSTDTFSGTIANARMAGSLSVKAKKILLAEGTWSAWRK